MTADDSIKCLCVNSGMTGQVGGFQNRGVCLQAFPSFLPHPLPALLLAPFFARSLTLVPRSLLLNRTETLATQAIHRIEMFSLTKMSNALRRSKAAVDFSLWKINCHVYIFRFLVKITDDIYMIYIIDIYNTYEI